MQPDNPTPDPELYLVGPTDNREIDRAIQISLLGAEAVESPATFLPEPEADFKQEWDRWSNGLFRKTIIPEFVGVYTATREMRHLEISRLDASLDADIPSPPGKRSLAAARIFLDRKADVRHMPQWVKFEDRIAAGSSAGHLATLFAIQSALFHVPVFPALISYAWLEWRAADSGNKDFSDPVFQRIAGVIRTAAQPPEEEKFFRVV